jgi:hypothetical protein
MPLQPIQFGRQFAEHSSGPLTAELAQNIYLEQAPDGAKSPYILLGTPGLKLFDTVGDGPIRGMKFMGDHLYVVSGAKVFRVNAAANAELVGYVTDSGPVEMEHNAPAPATGRDPRMWISTGHDLFSVMQGEILAVDNGAGVTDVAYQDGYLLGVPAGTQQLIISAIDDATTINALDFTRADALPGLAMGVISNHREVYVLCEDRLEVFYHVAGASFPFQRSQIVEQGCGSARSAAKYMGAIFFLGDDFNVYRLQGYQAQPISTPPVVAAITASISPSTAHGFTYAQGGHVFYVLCFTDLCLVYDVTTGLWHKRKTYERDDWRVRAHDYGRRWGKHIVGDVVNGNIYELDPDTHDENGGALVRRATGAPLWNNGNRFVVDEFFLDIEGGVGGTSDPQVMLDWSNDGGRTWGTELWRSFGQCGEWHTQPKWHALGAHYNWTPRITISDAAPVRIAGAYARITPMDA